MLWKLQPTHTSGGYQDHGSGKLETAWHFENDSDSPQSIDSKLLLIRGPDNGLLLQALTPASAVDSINNLTLARREWVSLSLQNSDRTS